MKVHEWIELLLNENQEAEVRYNIYWKNELDQWKIREPEEILIEPEPAFEKHISDLLDINIWFREPEGEDE